MCIYIYVCVYAYLSRDLGQLQRWLHMRTRNL